MTSTTERKSNEMHGLPPAQWLVAALGLAGAANAAPSGPATASETVNALAGRRVPRDPEQGRHGDHWMIASVHSVRPGQTFTRMDSGAPGAGSSIVTTVTAKTVYVDVVC